MLFCGTLEIPNKDTRDYGGMQLLNQTSVNYEYELVHSKGFTLCIIGAVLIIVPITFCLFYNSPEVDNNAHIGIRVSRRHIGQYRSAKIRSAFQVMPQQVPEQVQSPPTEVVVIPEMLPEIVPEIIQKNKTNNESQQEESHRNQWLRESWGKGINTNRN